MAEPQQQQKNAPKKAEKTADPIISQINQFGLYQFLICFLVFLSKFGTGWHTLSHIFLAAPANFTCIDPRNTTEHCADNKCKEYEFDKSVFKSTIVMEWDLVCKRAWLSTLSQSIVMMGIMFGSIFFGMISDKWGRRPGFLSCCFMQLITGLLVCVSPYFWVYCLTRFLVAFATGGTMVTSFVIIVEMIGPRVREIISILYQIPFNVGHTSLALFGYLIREWRWFQFSISIFHSVYVLYLCFIPESPRWLFVTGRLDKCIAILERIAKVNKLETETISGEIKAGHAALLARAPAKKGTFVDLFRTPYLRLKTIVMGFDWLAVCMTYYGVGQYMSLLGGNIFVNVGVSAGLGIPGTILCVILTIVLGRKLTLILSNATSAISLLILACFPHMSNLLQVICATIGLFGASVTFPNVYLYGAELFPTVVRSNGVGFCSMIGRIGSILAPLVADLNKIDKFLPPLIFGIISVIAAAGTFCLPETRGMPLPETLEDGETFGKKSKNKE